MVKCKIMYETMTEKLKGNNSSVPSSKVPFKLKFDPETVHMCTKLSGVVAAYSTKEKFDSILHFLSKRFVVV